MNPDHDLRVVCVLFGGGRGERLRPATFCVPKPLLPIARQMRMLDLSLVHLQRTLTNFQPAFYFTVGWKADTVSHYLRLRHPAVHVLRDTALQGTLGSLAQHHLSLRNTGADLLLLVPADYALSLDLVDAVSRMHDPAIECLALCSAQGSEQHHATCDTKGRIQKIGPRKTHPGPGYLGILLLRLSLLDVALEYCTSPAAGGFDQLTGFFAARRTAFVHLVPPHSVQDLGTWPRYIRFILTQSTSSNHLRAGSKCE